jgi:hypothetical protein
MFHAVKSSMRPVDGPFREEQSADGRLAALHRSNDGRVVDIMNQMSFLNLQQAHSAFNTTQAKQSRCLPASCHSRMPKTQIWELRVWWAYF